MHCPFSAMCSHYCTNILRYCTDMRLPQMPPPTKRSHRTYNIYVLTRLSAHKLIAYKIVIVIMITWLLFDPKFMAFHDRRIIRMLLSQ